MNDQGFNGSGSRFNARFGSGEEITAKQLNDLASGVQSALPIPYLGEGPSVSFTPGGSIITQNVDLNIKNPIYDFPFRIELQIYQDDSIPDTFTITPGTLNSLIPTYDNNTGLDNILTVLPRPEIPINYSNDGDSYIYLSAGANGTNSYTYPDNDPNTSGYPDVSSYSSMQNDSDDYGWCLLAKLTREVDEEGYATVTVNQMVQSSMWGERRKYSEPDTATYYFWGA